MKQATNSRVYWLYIGLITLAFVFSLAAHGQTVERRGNTFVQKCDSSSRIKKSDVQVTKYFYQTADGTKYPIYVSSNGKYFIIRVSSKTGKQYRQYLPEVTKQLLKPTAMWYEKNPTHVASKDYVTETRRAIGKTYKTHYEIQYA